MVYTARIEPNLDEEKRYTEERDYREKELNLAKWLNGISLAGAVIAFLGLMGLIVNAAIIHGQYVAMLESNKLTRQSLSVSQGAYVTVGRKDGVVADFVIPKDPKQNAEIVIYFQNSGHLPAKFTWGTLLSFGETETNKTHSGVTYTHPYQGGFSRAKDKKTGSISGPKHSAIIAGDSVFVSTFGVISKKDLLELPTNGIGLLVFGMFEYCDELGNSSTRQFALRYRSEAPSSSLSFDLLSDIALPISTLPESTATTEYFPACEAFAEREKNKKAN
jgi:hypothetical protein